MVTRPDQLPPCNSKLPLSPPSSSSGSQPQKTHHHLPHERLCSLDLLPSLTFPRIPLQTLRRLLSPDLTGTPPSSQSLQIVHHLFNFSSHAKTTLFTHNNHPSPPDLDPDRSNFRHRIGSIMVSDASSEASPSRRFLNAASLFLHRTRVRSSMMKPELQIQPQHANQRAISTEPNNHLEKNPLRPNTRQLPINLHFSVFNTSVHLRLTFPEHDLTGLGP
ncbi:hypothetical protein PIB30_018794 [Stylosanthes scabra]|uniref:Uncharacterized protein n=1 Tax=Stylosanthes scabra TaxID=79078 RepID=A0ABU6R8C0_9FABA|nr:hypothetical protein [Stylosanthes scabra]